MAGGTSASVGDADGCGAPVCGVWCVLVCALLDRLTMMNRHCERAPIPSFPHLKDSSGCGLWCAVCAVCAVCAPCAPCAAVTKLKVE